MRRLAIPFLLAAVLAGCSTTEPGKPSASDETGSAPTTGTPTGTATPVNRPKAVDLKTVEPCSLISAEQRVALGLSKVEPGNPLPDYGEGSKRCNQTYASVKFVSSIHTLLNGGVDRLKQTTGESKLTPLQVAGYPAYLAQREAPGGAPVCEIYVDAHDGQLLLVDAGGVFGEKGNTPEAACAQAKALAGAVGTALATK
ncbi:DUF3558 domain-containing protein [Lentzea flaviverrucosa]|uniref:DUF3558 domain-containing protein n=1 Tax=Lentzea flaviverrucosa TaxID=200379 RepID=A0A1H9PL89_9PSEU|nr:DUF3558 domain-containing protein [Lentzea flaviverrucosa]RDI29808.1 uncharacterized protein DUF3558 [Lentzea flaviverrucosa]SER48860.1 Protein of unknown function [Lentzea flaviverrucosa]